MKTVRKFKPSRFFAAVVGAVVISEVIAWKLAEAYGFKLNPLTVAFLAVGLVAVVTSIVYEGTDIG